MWFGLKILSDMFTTHLAFRNYRFNHWCKHSASPWKSELITTWGKSLVSKTFICCRKSQWSKWTQMLYMFFTTKLRRWGLALSLINDSVMKQFEHTEPLFKERPQLSLIIHISKSRPALCLSLSVFLLRLFVSQVFPNILPASSEWLTSGVMGEAITKMFTVCLAT